MGITSGGDGVSVWIRNYIDGKMVGRRSEIILSAHPGVGKVIQMDGFPYLFKVVK